MLAFLRKLICVSEITNDCETTQPIDVLIRTWKPRSIPNDEILTSGLHHFFRHHLELVCCQNMLHLHHEPLNQADIATGDNYLSAFYHRIARRRGKQKAIMALSHKVLLVLYHVLRGKKSSADLGADSFDQLDATRIQRHHIQRLEQLGFAVTLTPKEAA